MTTIWFQLTTANGKRVPGTVDFVELAKTSTVGNLRDAVKGKCANDLEKVDANKLLVYANAEALKRDKDEPEPKHWLKAGKTLDSVLEEAKDHSDENPLLIVVPERVPPTNSDAAVETGVVRLQLFLGKAKKPNLNTNVPTFNHKIHIPSYLVQHGLRTIFRIDGEKDVDIPTDSNGYTILTWEAKKVYKIRGRQAGDADQEISFSSDHAKDLFKVEDDFNIKDSSLFLTMTTAVEVPEKSIDYVCHFLTIFCKHHTKRLESSRRFVVGLFLNEAIDQVAISLSRLIIDEEMEISVITEVNKRPGKPFLVKYHGAVDFAVGHAVRVGERLRNDTAVVAIEVKRGTTYAESEAQVLAQAATSLLVRQKQKRGWQLGEDVVYYIRTTGETWEFGRLISEGDGSLLREKSESVYLDLSSESVDRGEVGQVLSWFVFILNKAKDSSPRASLVELRPDSRVENLASRVSRLNV
ncbi:hypothetical protein DFS34DRAFT_283795 [Phlyctochytrium arcticum]|nr:hypothetical protein DFS34DRAFT_283795 [Phlyctochytrium arcticum]